MLFLEIFQMVLQAPDCEICAPLDFAKMQSGGALNNLVYFIAHSQCKRFLCLVKIRNFLRLGLHRLHSGCTYFLNIAANRSSIIARSKTFPTGTEKNFPGLTYKSSAIRMNLTAKRKNAMHTKRSFLVLFLLYAKKAIAKSAIESISTIHIIGAASVSALPNSLFKGSHGAIITSPC